MVIVGEHNDRKGLFIMKKRLLSFLLIAATLLTMAMGTISTVYADEPEINISPMMLYISTISPDLSFSGSTASLKCIVKGIAGTTTKIMVTGTLQRYVSGEWRDISASTQKKEYYRMTYSRTTPSLTGYSYRAMYVVKAYSGSSYEMRTVYSKVVGLN